MYSSSIRHESHLDPERVERQVAGQCHETDDEEDETTHVTLTAPAAADAASSVHERMVAAGPACWHLSGTAC